MGQKSWYGTCWYDHTRVFLPIIISKQLNELILMQCSVLSTVQHIKISSDYYHGSKIQVWTLLVWPYSSSFENTVSCAHYWVRTTSGSIPGFFLPIIISKQLTDGHGGFPEKNCEVSNYQLGVPCLWPTWRFKEILLPSFIFPLKSAKKGLQTLGHICFSKPICLSVPRLCAFVSVHL